MAGKLDRKKIAFLVATEGVEQVELTEPWKAGRGIVPASVGASAS
jgi:hypothetical protein